MAAATGAGAAPSKPVVGYWKIRGLAQPVRTVLKYLNVDFEDVHYEQGDAPEFSRDAWLKVKSSALADEMDFPNLPYYIDGDVKLTQSQAILRYIARKYGAGSGLYEGSAEELACADVMLDQVVDMRQSFTRCCYGGMPYATLREGVLPPFLAGFEKVLAKGAGRPFLCGGERPTLADFCLHEVLDGVTALVHEAPETAGEDALAAYPALKAFKARFEALPAVAAYRASPAYMARPFNNKVAVWK